MKTASFDEMLEDFKNGVYDFTKDGKCIGCGACCSRFLPMSQREIDTIKKYIKRHNIKKQMHGVNVLAVPSLDFMCPFLDDTKQDRKCTIYEVRPLVCKKFICNCKLRPDKEIVNAKLEPVDVLETFFPEDNTWPIEELVNFN